MRRGTVFAWCLVALSCAFFLIDTIVVADTQTLVSEDALTRHGWPVVNLASIGATVIGAVIVTRVGRNPVGWLLTAVGTGTSMSLVAESYAYWAYETGDPTAHPYSTLAANVSTVTGGVLALTCLTWVFLIVPDGHFLSRRWRRLAFFAIVAYVLFTAGQLSYDPFLTMNGPDDFSQVPYVSQWMVNIGFASVAICVLASVYAMTVRLRRSTGETRQQLRWIATGASGIGVGVLCVVIGQILNGGDSTWYTNMPLYLAYLFLLVTIAIAVLRYRLYDVGLVINRAVLVTVTAVFVAGCYILLVTLVSSTAGGVADGFGWSLAATVLIALFFQVIRYRVTQFADRLAYGKQAAPYETLVRLSRDLGARPDPRSLPSTVAEAAGRATLATMTRVRLGPPDAPATTAIWPDDGQAWSGDDGSCVEVQIADREGPLGSIVVVPAPGVPLRDQDHRLLSDLADQAAVSFRNVALEVELAAKVRQLDEQTDALAASRRRLIEAGDAERRRIEEAISREVMPELTGVRATLVALRDGTDPPADPGHLVEDATRALEALRELTRGVFPTLLTRSGLSAALTTYFARLGRPDDLEIGEDVRGRRFEERIEIAAYYCATQSVANVSGPSRVAVRRERDWLRIDVVVTETSQLDLPALTDRVEACGGVMTIDDQTWTASHADLAIRLPALDQSRTADSQA